MQAVGGGWCDLSCRTWALRNLDLGERELLIQGLKQQWGILVDGHAITSMREDHQPGWCVFFLVLVITNWKWRQSFDIFSPWRNLEALEIAAWMCWTVYKTLLTSDQVVVFYAFLEVSKSHCDLFEGQAHKKPGIQMGGRIRWRVLTVLPRSCLGLTTHRPLRRADQKEAWTS